MMSSEVRAASKSKYWANLRSPTMRDLVYEVESPWWLCNTAVYADFRPILIVVSRNFEWIFELWEFPEAAMMSSEVRPISKSKIRTEIAQNHYQNRSQYVRVLCTSKKIPLAINQASIDDLTRENAHRGCYDVLKGQGSLRTQKFVWTIDPVYKKS